MARKAKSIRSRIAASLKPKKTRKSRSKYSPRFKAAVKRIRSAIGKLKRKKLAPKEIDARKILPNRQLRRLVNKHKAVVSGEATTFTVAGLDANALKLLKDAGYKVSGKGSNKRVTVPKTQYVRKGKVYERPTKSRRGYRVERESMEPDEYEAKIRNAFAKLKEGDLVGFEIGGEGGKGGKSYHLYGSADSMLADLMAYGERGFQINYLATFKVTKAKQQAYAHNAATRAQQRVIGSPAFRARRAQYARDYRDKKRAQTQGRPRGRTSRGH